MFRLYEYAPSGNCYKIRLLLGLLGIKFERVAVDIQSGGSRTEEFLKLNANGRVPVLVHDDRVLTESNAILWYLGRGTLYVPDDKLDQARVLQWMFFEQYSHEPYIATLRNWISYTGKEKEFAEEIEKRRPLGYAALDVMNKRLSKHHFFVGEQYSIADISLFAYTHVANEGGFELKSYSGIIDWLARVRAQPGHVAIDV